MLVLQKKSSPCFYRGDDFFVYNLSNSYGLIGISVKKIRDDSGYWKQLEAYLSVHTDVTFSHGICPDCAQKLYGDFIGVEEALKKE